MNKKIVYAGYLENLSNAYFRAKTLEEMGYEVFYFNAHDYLPNNYFLKINNHLGTKLGLRKINKKLFRLLIDYKPFMLFCDKTIWLYSNTLVKANELGIVTVHFNPDDPFGKFYNRGWDLFINSIPHYKFHFVAREQNISEYKTYGASNVFAYDRAFKKGFHRRIELKGDDLSKYSTEVGFIGACGWERAESIAYLIKNGIPVSVYGDGWPNKPFWDIIKPYYRGGSLYGDDYIKAINGMKIALHFLRHENRDEQDSRTFEIPACGSFMLAERSATHERLFKEDTEAVFFSNNEELKRKVEYYLKNDKERFIISQNGFAKCHNQGYDHVSRLSDLLNKINSTINHNI